MKPFQWGPDYFTYLEDVDEQHYQLVSLINQLGEHISNDNINQEYINGLVEQLTDYVLYHFSEEEHIMAEYKIDSRHLKVHVMAHKSFVSTIESISSATPIDNRDTANSYFRFLVQWLSEHILKQDKKMAAQIQAIKSGLSPSEAFYKSDCDCVNATEPLLDALHSLYNEVLLKNEELKELNLSLESKIIIRTKELSQANAHLEKLSITDPLTTLPNRRHALISFDELWKESVINETPLSCLMIDVDSFKRINDMYGHAKGDEVLQVVAQTLQDNIRTDDILCRLGGDEFILLCPNTEKEGAIVLADMLLSKVRALNVETGNEPYRGSISVGLSSRGESMAHYDDLMKASDNALYMAKAAGKNCVKYE